MPRPDPLGPFGRYVRQMVREQRTGLVIAMCFAFISAGGLGAGIVALKPIFEVLGPNQSATPAELARGFNADDPMLAIPEWIITRLPDDPYHFVVLAVIALAIMTVIGGAANFAHQYLSQTITTRMVANIRRDAFERVLRLPLDDVVQRGPSEFVARIVRDAAELQRGLIALVSKSVTQVTKGFAAFAVAVILDWRLTLIAVIGAPILGVVLRKIGTRIRRGTRGSLQAQEDLLRVSTETLQGLRAVKANVAETMARARFETENERVVTHELRVRTARAASSPLVELIAVFAVLGLALVAAKAVLGGTLDPAEVILTMGALGVAGGSFRPLAGLINEMQAAAAPAERLSEILDLDAEPDAGTVELPRHTSSIRFEHVSYTYPGADAPAVDDVSITIDHGECVAIVGANGSGKTTLLSMLPRLLTPTAGRILIDDVDIATATLASVRGQIGVVTQDAVLVRGTVAENIAFGRDDATRADIESAARRAHAHDFIMELPGGYDADLAEQGASLSGGQRQRLAIARALVRDPAILILDEATSQVDATSDELINDAIRDFADGRTVLLIAHRPETIARADRVIELTVPRASESCATESAHPG